MREGEFCMVYNSYYGAWRRWVGILYWIMFFLPTIVVYPKEAVIQLKQGNLALPGSQQPNPIIAFGQNIVDKHDRQIFADFALVKGAGKSFTIAMPAFLYGISDTVSILCSLPIASQKLKQDHASGVGDFFVQGEYEFYAKLKESLTDQATVVGTLILPTGSGSKNPNTGLGSPGFFLGATLSRTTIDWYFFASPGVVITTTNNERKYGNQYLLQCGIGRNIPSPSGTIIAGMVELCGLFVQPNTTYGIINTDDSAINAGVYCTPSLWFSSEKFIVQAGIGFPLFQETSDGQVPNDYSVAVNCGVKF